MTGQKIFVEDGPRERARQVVETLSLEEQVWCKPKLRSSLLTFKVALLAGNDFWRTVPISSKGIPSIKTTDGPNGARGALFKDGTPVSIQACSKETMPLTSVGRLVPLWYIFSRELEC